MYKIVVTIGRDTFVDIAPNYESAVTRAFKMFEDLGVSGVMVSPGLFRHKNSQHGSYKLVATINKVK